MEAGVPRNSGTARVGEEQKRGEGNCRQGVLGALSQRGVLRLEEGVARPEVMGEEFLQQETLLLEKDGVWGGCSLSRERFLVGVLKMLGTERFGSFSSKDPEVLVCFILLSRDTLQRIDKSQEEARERLGDKVQDEETESVVVMVDLSAG